MEFQVGDKVKMEGVVAEIEHGSIYPIKVKFKEGAYSFTRDGKFTCSDLSPILELVERPKKLVKRWRWVYRCDSGLEVTDEYYHDQAEFTKVIGCTDGCCKLIQKIDTTEMTAVE